MPTKDSSCLQRKEGNASVDSNHTVHRGLVQHWSRLRGTQWDCQWSMDLLLRIIWKSYDCKSLCESSLKSLRGWMDVLGGLISRAQAT